MTLYHSCLDELILLLLLLLLLLGLRANQKTTRKKALPERGLYKISKREPKWSSDQQEIRMENYEDRLEALTNQMPIGRLLEFLQVPTLKHPTRKPVPFINPSRYKTLPELLRSTPNWLELVTMRKAGSSGNPCLLPGNQSIPQRMIRIVMDLV